MANTSPHGEGEQTARIIGAAACLWAVAPGADTAAPGVASGALGNAVTSAVLASAAPSPRWSRVAPMTLPCLVLSIAVSCSPRWPASLRFRQARQRPTCALAAAAATTASIVLLRVTDCGTQYDDGRRQSVDAGGDGLSLRRCMDHVRSGGRSAARHRRPGHAQRRCKAVDPAVPAVAGDADCRRRDRGGRGSKPNPGSPGGSWPPNADRPRGGVLGGGRGGVALVAWLATAAADTGWSAPCSPVSSGRCCAAGTAACRHRSRGRTRRVRNHMRHSRVRIDCSVYPPAGELGNRHDRDRRRGRAARGVRCAGQSGRAPQRRSAGVPRWRLWCHWHVGSSVFMAYSAA